MIYNLRKLDSIDIVDKFNYLVILKKQNKKNTMLLFHMVNNRIFLMKVKKIDGLNLVKIYKIILNKINKSSGDAYVNSDASGDADTSVDKKNIIFFGHSAGGVIAQLILYQFYLNKQLEKYNNPGMITSGIFQYGKKRKIKICL